MIIRQNTPSFMYCVWESHEWPKTTKDLFSIGSCHIKLKIEHLSKYYEVLVVVEEYCVDSSGVTRSSVRFLESSSSTFTTEFLWFTSSGIWNDKTLIILQKSFLQLSFGALVVVLLVVCDHRLGNSHSNRHNLVHGTSTLDSNSNAQIFESVFSEEENWLIDLSSHWFWFNKLKWFTIDSDNSNAFLAKSNCSCILLLPESSYLFSFVTHYFLDMMHKQRLY